MRRSPQNVRVQRCSFYKGVPFVSAWLNEPMARLGVDPLNSMTRCSRLLLYFITFNRKLLRPSFKSALSRHADGRASRLGWWLLPRHRATPSISATRRFMSIAEVEHVISIEPSYLSCCRLKLLRKLPHWHLGTSVQRHRRSKPDIGTVATAGSFASSLKRTAPVRPDKLKLEHLQRWYLTIRPPKHGLLLVGSDRWHSPTRQSSRVSLAPRTIRGPESCVD